MKSHYEQLLDIWLALGGTRFNHTIEPWSFAGYPSYDWLLGHISHLSIGATNGS